MPIPNDSLLTNQWYLNNPNANLLDLNIFGVWNASEGPSYTGAGTRTFVIDNGFDFTHSDLAPNYNDGLDFDFETNTLTALGNPTDSHGTAVMGIIGAAANGSGVVGVAYETDLVGYRTANLISDAWLQDVRDAIEAAGSAIRFGDVVSISQGIANDASSEFGVGYDLTRFAEIRTAIGNSVEDGRGGLGVTIVKSAGNSRSDNYDVNADLWTNDTRQVVVAAVDQDGFVSSYSSYGAAILVSAFGTPGEVFTTDRVGADGYDGSDFTGSFNGTSAAAPMVAGIVGLMYEANADLGWRDVQSILGVSARHVGSEVGDGVTGSERNAWHFNGASTWNGGGQHFSADYGYGLVDAHAAVRLSETWLISGASAMTSANELTNTMDLLDVTTVVPDGNFTGLSYTGTASSNDIVERVTVEIDFSTTFTADVEIYLTSPSGVEHLLIGDTGGGNNFDGIWSFESQAFRGERAAGDWTVRVVDDAGGDVLTLRDIVVRTYGAATFDDRYIFTNEYSDYSSGVFGHTTVVNDSNGGNDTVNAAAVTSASTIRLDGGQGAIDGVGVSFSNIEHAVGGDAGDTIIGNDGGNRLYGMRGNDVLRGLNGSDILDGGTGNDILNGGAGIDTLFGRAGRDILRGENGNDRLLGGGEDDILQGGAGADELNGGSGTDRAQYTDAGAGVLADLRDVGLNTGFAAGDTYISIEHLTGSFYADDLRGDESANVISGEAGDDLIYGRNGDDILLGMDGHDRLDGGSGRDVLNGDAGRDALFGGAGADTLRGQGGNDTLFGGENDDFMQGGAGDDVLVGGYGADYMQGGDRRDVLEGGFDADILLGEQGDDRLQGDQGADSLTGGNGFDHFIFISASDSLNSTARRDVITDFTRGQDRIDLSQLDAGRGIAGDQAFTFRGSAHLQDLDIGQVRYNAGPGTSVVVAVDVDADGVGDMHILVQGVTALDASDFIL